MRVTKGYYVSATEAVRVVRNTIPGGGEMFEKTDLSLVSLTLRSARSHVGSGRDTFREVRP